MLELGRLDQQDNALDVDFVVTNDDKIIKTSYIRFDKQNVLLHYLHSWML